MSVNKYENLPGNFYFMSEIMYMAKAEILEVMADNF
jgi:hypothetical protein